MDVLVLVLALLVMLVGLFGAVVPVVPGLLLVWAAAVGSVLWQGADTAGWAVAGVLTAMFVLATAATVYLPTRTGRQGGVPSSTLGTTVLGATVGFVVIPVVGLLVGAAAGLYLGERSRLGGHEDALASTYRVVRAYGAGVLVQLVVGVTMILVWGVAVVVRY